MLTYYCLSCWQELPQHTKICPHCGADTGSFDELQYEQKLLKTAFHPIAENRHMAVQVLGMLRTPRALPVLAQILHEEKDDVYLLFQVLQALTNIPDPTSTELLTEAKLHPYRLVRDRARQYLEEIKKKGRGS
jgi:hypothetical protein